MIAVVKPFEYDRLGRETYPGDFIAYTLKNGGPLRMGKIVNITEKGNLTVVPVMRERKQYFLSTEVQILKSIGFIRLNGLESLIGEIHDM